MQREDSMVLDWSLGRKGGGRRRCTLSFHSMRVSGKKNTKKREKQKSNNKTKQNKKGKRKKGETAKVIKEKKKINK